MSNFDRAEAIVRDFLGLEESQAIPSRFDDLVDNIAEALASKDAKD